MKPYCDCCDHPLEHTIREVLSRIDAPIPSPSLREIAGRLNDGLEAWREERDLALGYTVRVALPAPSGEVA